MPNKHTDPTTDPLFEVVKVNPEEVSDELDMDELEDVAGGVGGQDPLKSSVEDPGFGV